ncbi:MAG TPA: MMPL family transporter, partial [Euzebya sp.]|nr:MMPL family transporter [Euzebya sp.]
MNRVVIMLSRAVRRAPVITLVVAFLLTTALGAFASQIEQGGGNEGFSPNNPELLAQQRVAEAFGSDGDVVLQVLLRSEDGGDLVSPTGLQAVVALQEALEASPEADTLVQRPEQPPVVSPLGPVLQGAGEQGLDPGQLDGATVDALFVEALAQLPGEQTGFITGLLPDDVDPAQADADAALAVVFLDPVALPDDDLETAAVLSDIAQTIQGVDVDGVILEPFAFQLLFASTDTFTAEVSRLFTAALLIIILILSLIYATAPSSDGTWLGSVRRTAADVGLTLLVVIMAILWVQGAAGLLGPNVLGLIDALAEPAQILPVLLIGLGVDYGIHLTARYREEVGAQREVSEAIGTATRTVGLALVLATLTTAVGFLTNITAPVPALRDFGILAAVGIVAAFLLMLTVFPAARLLLDRRAEAAGRLPRQTLSASGEGVLPKLMGRVAILAERAAIPTLVLTVGIGGVLGGIGLANVSTEFSFTDFLPEDDPLIVTFDTITERFGGGFGEVTTAVVDGPLTPAVHNAMVQAGDDLAEVDGVVTFGEAAAASSPVSVLGQILASLAPQGGAAPPGAGLAQPVDAALGGQITALLDPQSLTVPA